MNSNYSSLCTVFIVTYYSEDKIRHCLDSISNKYKIIIFDNSGQLDNKKKIEKSYPNIHYIVSKKNLGIPRAYNFGLSVIDTEYMFTTQPDVILRKNCIDHLLDAALKYTSAGIVSPITYHNKKYILDGDHKALRIDKLNKKIIFDNKDMNKKIYDKIPEGDLCVEGVTGTAMLIKRSFLIKAGRWDKKIFSYWEDMDICARMRLNNYLVIKASKAELDHAAFSSHNVILNDSVNYFRNWHYTWSSYYIRIKYNQYISAILYLLRIGILNSLKILFYFIFFKNKYLTAKAKLYGLMASVLKRPSYFRIK